MGVEFIDGRVKIKNQIKTNIIAALIECAGEMKSQIQRNSRVDTGQTKGSYQYKIDRTNMVATIGSNSENAVWEEFGTGEYALHGDGRKGGWKYQDVKGKWHHTKGKKPNRPMFRAFTSLKDKIINRLERAI